MIPAQSNDLSLAGMLSIVMVYNLSKPDIHQPNIRPMFSQLTYLKSQGCKADLKTPDHQKQNEKKDSTANAILSTTDNSYQPFGSIPNRSSSLRPSVLSQLPRLIFSAAAAASNCALSSGAIRIWNVGDFPEADCFMSRFAVDMYVPITLGLRNSGTYPSIVVPENETPLFSITSTGKGLTTTVITSIEVAVMKNITHPQGRHSITQNSGDRPPSFIWIIAAVRRDCPTVKATIHHIAADTEHEARRTLAKDHICFFAGRIAQGVDYA